MAHHTAKDCALRVIDEPYFVNDNATPPRFTSGKYLDGAIRSDLDVGRFQITMDDSLRMGGSERFSDLPGDWQCLVERQ
jgi:hypothetical protein